MSEHPLPLHRGTWLEIDLTAIAHNIRQLRSYLPAQTKIMAAVKADAYGHGAVPTAKTALDAGAEALAVGTLDEALALRESGIDAYVLVLTPILPQDADIAVRHDISVTVCQAEWMKQMREHKHSKAKLKVHIKLDTGLNRIGIRRWNEWTELVPWLYADDIEVDGVYTHCAAANQDDTSELYRQIDRFMSFVRRIQSDTQHPRINSFHFANSAAALRCPALALDYARIGIAMYGIYPSDALRKTLPLSLKPALSLHSTIIQVKRLHAGERLGYDYAYTAPADEWIATVCIGYGDGWSRSLQGSEVLVGGERAQIVGPICMDQLTVRLPRFHPAGTRVTLFGEQHGRIITLEELAAHIGSIPQEIATMITSRVPRLHAAADRRTVTEMRPFSRSIGDRLQAPYAAGAHPHTSSRETY